MALAWAAGILAASLALALATRGPPPAEVKAKPQQLLGDGKKAAPTRQSAGVARAARQRARSPSTLLR
jgi:hypothetical protein